MTEYAFKYIISQAGQIADGSLRVIDSYANGPSANLAFGVAVHLGGLNNQQVFKSTSADAVLGISIYSPTHFKGYYDPNDAVSVMTQGRVYVATADTINPGDVAHIDATGLFTKVSAGNKLVGTFIMPNVDGLTVLEFNSDVINIV